MMKNFLLYMGIPFLISFPAHSLKLYLLSNHDNAGDYNQVLGVQSAFEKLSHEPVGVEDLNTKMLTTAEIKEKVQKDLQNEKVIVIGAGEGGIDGLAALPKQSHLITCLTSHMFLDRYKDKALLEKVDFIALPTHVSAKEKEMLGSKLIETIGVAHNRRPDMATYEVWKKELPPADIYLGVYLGGDAPTQTKEMKRFTEEDAARLANYVSRQVKELTAKGLKPYVLVLNGPRTGKHDAEGKEIPTAHREGKSDLITESFGNKLANQGVEYKVFDFQYNTPENKKWVSAYNAFDLVMGAVRATQGQMIIPGESTSVVSETIDALPSGKVLVYYNGAMNDVHKAHLASELDAGRISTLENYQDIKRVESKRTETKPSATQIIAQRLVEAASAPGG